MFIFGVFVNLWAVITVYTFYSVFMSLLEMSVLIFTVTFNHLCIIYTLLQDSQHFTNVR